MSRKIFFCIVWKLLADLKPACFSNKPKRGYLSKHLIALLSFGGVPNEFFMDLLRSNMADANHVYSNKRSALRGSWSMLLLVIFHQNLFFIWTQVYLFCFPKSTCFCLCLINSQHPSTVARRMNTMQQKWFYVAFLWTSHFWSIISLDLRGRKKRNLEEGSFICLIVSI